MTEHSHRRVALRVVLIANAVLWLLVWGAFARASHPFVEHRPVWEERYPLVIVFHHAALPDFELKLFSPVLLLHLPSTVVARLIEISVANRHPEVWEHEFIGTSLHGYTVLATMLLSFLQWYWTARAAIWFVRRVHSPTRSAGDGDSLC
jgi:hypothetical protein